VVTGWAQFVDTALVLISTCGITCAMFARYARSRIVDFPIRLLVAVVSFVVMFHPNGTVAAAVVVVVLPAIVIGIWRHRQIAPIRPEPDVMETNADAAPKGDLSALMTEGRREIG
jgi:hypothetical protein